MVGSSRHKQVDRRGPVLLLLHREAVLERNKGCRECYTIPEDDLELGQSHLLEADNRVVLPAKSHIRFIVTSADVPHSWIVPSLGVKCDVVPGRLNHTSILVWKQYCRPLGAIAKPSRIKESSPYSNSKRPTYSLSTGSLCKEGKASMQVEKGGGQAMGTRRNRTISGVDRGLDLDVESSSQVEDDPLVDQDLNGYNRTTAIDAGDACRWPFFYFSGVNDTALSVMETARCAWVKEIRFSSLGCLLAYSTS
ncbi:cytochrome c oxidase subunit 2 [Capsicum baccatum]|uniref:Cytochrome c oxidase polypeptide II n=1 Tax=Capsicum baccatum TaxID=33114 RepID=A0A2G2V4Y4_CAPBA|nr:cytochrome c oxidase subunit 2 [Capsicum baccatum]